MQGNTHTTSIALMPLKTKDSTRRNKTKEQTLYTQKFVTAKDPVPSQEVQKTEEKKLALALQKLYGEEKPVYLTQKESVKTIASHPKYALLRKQYITLLKTIGQWVKENGMQYAKDWEDLANTKIFNKEDVKPEEVPVLYKHIKQRLERIYLYLHSKQLTLGYKKEILTEVNNVVGSCISGTMDSINKALSNFVGVGSNGAWTHIKTNLVNDLMLRYFFEKLKFKPANRENQRIASWERHQLAYLFNAVVREKFYGLQEQKFDHHLTAGERQIKKRIKELRKTNKSLETPGKYVDRRITAYLIETLMNEARNIVRDDPGVYIDIQPQESKEKKPNTACQRALKEGKVIYRIELEKKKNQLIVKEVNHFSKKHAPKTISSYILWEIKNIFKKYKNITINEKSNSNFQALKRELKKPILSHHSAAQYQDRLAKVQRYLSQFCQNEAETKHFSQNLFVQDIEKGLTEAFDPHRTGRLLMSFLVKNLMQNGYLNKNAFLSKANPNFYRIKVNNETSLFKGEKTLQLDFLKIGDELALYQVNGEYIKKDLRDILDEKFEEGVKFTAQICQNEKFQPVFTEFYLGNLPYEEKLLTWMQEFEKDPSKLIDFSSIRKNGFLNIIGVTKALNKIHKKMPRHMSNRIWKAVLSEIKIQIHKKERSESYLKKLESVRKNILINHPISDMKEHFRPGEYSLNLTPQELEKKHSLDEKLTPNSTRSITLFKFDNKLEIYSDEKNQSERKRLTFEKINPHTLKNNPKNIAALNAFLAFEDSQPREIQLNSENKNKLLALYAQLIVENLKNTRSRAETLEAAYSLYYSELLEALQKNKHPALKNAIDDFFKILLAKRSKFALTLLEKSTLDINYLLRKGLTRIPSIKLIEQKTKLKASASNAEPKDALIQILRIDEKLFLLNEKTHQKNHNLPVKLQNIISNNETFMDALYKRLKTLNVEQSEEFFDRHFGNDFRKWALKKELMQLIQDPTSVSFYRKKILNLGLEPTTIESKSLASRPSSDFNIMGDILSEAKVTSPKVWEKFLYAVINYKSPKDSENDIAQARLDAVKIILRKNHLSEESKHITPLKIPCELIQESKYGSTIKTQKEERLFVVISEALPKPVVYFPDKAVINARNTKLSHESNLNFAAKIYESAFKHYHDESKANAIATQAMELHYSPDHDIERKVLLYLKATELSPNKVSFLSSKIGILPADFNHHFEKIANILLDIGEKNPEKITANMRTALFKKALRKNNFFLAKKICSLKKPGTFNAKAILNERVKILANQNDRTNSLFDLLRAFPTLAPQIPHYSMCGLRYTSNNAEEILIDKARIMGLLIQQSGWFSRTHYIKLFQRPTGWNVNIGYEDPLFTNIHNVCSPLLEDIEKSCLNPFVIDFMKTFSPYAYTEFTLFSDELSYQFFKGGSSYLRLKIALIWFFELTAISRLIQDFRDPRTQRSKNLILCHITFLLLTGLLTLPITLVKNTLKFFTELPLRIIERIIKQKEKINYHKYGNIKGFPEMLALVFRLAYLSVSCLLSPLKTLQSLYHSSGGIFFAAFSFMLLCVIITPILITVWPLLLAGLTAFLCALGLKIGAAALACIKLTAAPTLAASSISSTLVEQRTPKKHSAKFFKPVAATEMCDMRSEQAEEKMPLLLSRVHHPVV